METKVLKQEDLTVLALIDSLLRLLTNGRGKEGD